MSTVARIATSPAQRPAEGSRPIGVSRRLLGVIIALAAAAWPWLQLQGAWTPVALLLLGTVVATGLAAPAPGAGRLCVAHWLPAGFALGITAITVAGLAAAAVSVPIWADGTAALAMWTVLVVIAAIPAAVRGGRVRIVPNATVATVLALPLALVTAITALLPFEVWARIVSRGTDFPRHVVMVVQTGSDGYLDYAANAYPRSAHAAAAVIQQTTGNLDYFEAWRAAEALLLVMLALAAAAAAMIAERMMSSLGAPGGRPAAVLVPIATMGLFIFGPFVTGLVSPGFITTIQAALILTAGALLFWDGDRPSPATAASLLLLCALLSNTWVLLLPVAALPAAWYGYRLLKSGRRRGLVILAAAVAAAASLPVVWVSVTKIGISATATPGALALPALGIAWLVVLSGAGLGIVAVRRSGQPSAATANMLFLLGLMLTLVMLTAIWDRSDEGSYYLVKSAWTPLPVLIGLGIPGIVWFISRRSKRLQVAGAVVLVVAAVVALPATARESAKVLTGQNPSFAVTLPFVDQMSRLDPESGRVVLVWGINPHRADATSYGSADYVAATAGYFQGFELPDDDTVRAIREHDPVQVCRYLEANPDTIRVTGPYMDGPLQWLTDAGCPASVTRPDNWVSIQFGPQWYVGTKNEGVPFGQDYPSWWQAEQESQTSD